MRVAVTRKISPALSRCELTHLQRSPIDLALAEAQHALYEQRLAGLGCKVFSLPTEPELPDSVFVEDVAIVVDELAILTRPGAASRRPETASIEPALAAYRPVVRIEAPGTLDGGDVLRIARKLYVGVSGRTNREGVDQLRRLLLPFGYTVDAVNVRGCLHLKSAVTQVTPEAVLMNTAWVSRDAIPGMDVIEVAPGDDYGANCLLIDRTAVYPTSFPRTRERIEQHGIEVAAVDVSELQKAEGAVTCCSLIFEHAM